MKRIIRNIFLLLLGILYLIIIYKNSNYDVHSCYIVDKIIEKDKIIWKIHNIHTTKEFCNPYIKKCNYTGIITCNYYYGGCIDTHRYKVSRFYTYRCHCDKNNEKCFWNDMNLPSLFIAMLTLVIFFISLLIMIFEIAIMFNNLNCILKHFNKYNKND